MIADAVFHVARPDHRGLGVFDLPGCGLFGFFLLHKFPLLGTVFVPGGEIILYSGGISC
jgi:hypothetical protein